MGMGLMLFALRDNIVFFYTPSQLAAKSAEAGFDTARTMRIGGIVKAESVVNVTGGVDFTITDFSGDLPVRYRGMIPNLFREGQGVVAQGTIGADGVMTAASILAKHDENYMPREVVDALRASGRWQGDGRMNGATP